MTPLADVIEIVLKHLTDRIAVALLLAAMIITLVSKIISIPWVNEHSVWLWITMLVCVCYLPTRPIVSWYAEWEDRTKLERKQRAGEKEKEKRLQWLTPDEKRLLNEFVTRNSRSGSIHRQDAAIALALETDGMLYPASDAWVGLSRPYNIEPWVLEYLKKSRNLLQNG